MGKTRVYYILLLLVLTLTDIVTHTIYTHKADPGHNLLVILSNRKWITQSSIGMHYCKLNQKIKRCMPKIPLNRYTYMYSQ